MVTKLADRLPERMLPRLAGGERTDLAKKCLPAFQFGASFMCTCSEREMPLVRWKRDQSAGLFLWIAH